MDIRKYATGTLLIDRKASDSLGKDSKECASIYNSNTRIDVTCTYIYAENRQTKGH